MGAAPSTFHLLLSTLLLSLNPQLLHILYFHQHFCTPDGTSGTRSYEFARRLVSRGHRVTMVCGSYQRCGLELPERKGIVRQGKVAGINVIQFVMPYSNHDGFLMRTVTFLRYAMKSSRIAVSRDYDLLFATSTPLTAGIPGICMKLALRRKPFVFEVRDLWPELPKAMGVIRNPLVLGTMAFLEWATYRAADRCIGLAPGIADGIRKKCREKPIAMIPNGCDTDSFGSIRVSQRELRPFQGRDGSPATR